MLQFQRSVLAWLFVIISIPNLFSQTRIPPEKPKLIIGIVIEDLRHDYINRYWDQFGKNGFRKLVNQGSYCKNTTFDYLLAQPSSGLASIVTGSPPATHGIVSDLWYDRNNDELNDCIYDKKQNLVGEGSLSGKVSPKAILTSTFSDELKISKPTSAKTIAISPEMNNAVITGGHNADAAYWFDHASGNWVSNTYYMNSLPTWLIDFNAKKFPDLYFEKEWNPLLPLADYAESLADNNKYERGFENAGFEFPYSMEKLKGRKNAYEMLFSTPFGNTFCKDFFLETIINENLGTDNETDVLLVTLNSFAKIENLFGQKSIEMEDAFLRFDKEVEHFLEFIDEQLGKENVLVYVTSNSYALPDIEFLQDNRIPVDYFEVDKASVLLKAYLNAVYGAGDWVLKFYNQQVYLNRELIEDSKLELSEVQQKVALFLMEISGVQKAVSSFDLQTDEYTEGLMALMQNSFYFKRSGDVFIQLQPGWIERNGNSLNGKSGISASVPLIWYGWKIKRSTINRKVSIFDIAPTLSNILNINKPAGCEGKVILELIE
jgi:predicted AlkP superfamily pyrophosphatase or phosphodiesterase